MTHPEAPESDEPTIGHRLRQLADIEPGWNEGEGEKISATALRVAREIALPVADAGFPPHLYPTEAGGVSAEWSSPSREISVEVEPTGIVYVHVLEIETKVYRDFEADESASALRLILDALTAPQ